MKKDDIKNTLNLHNISLYYGVLRKHYRQHLGILIMGFASMLIGILVSLASPGRVKEGHETEIDLSGNAMAVNRKGESFGLLGFEVLIAPTSVVEVK